jgi:hypothetical protein
MEGQGKGGEGKDEWRDERRTKRYKRKGEGGGERRKMQED